VKNKLQEKLLQICSKTGNKTLRRRPSPDFHCTLDVRIT